MNAKDIQIEFERTYTHARANRSTKCAPRVRDYMEPYQSMYEAFQDGIKYGLKMAKTED